MPRYSFPRGLAYMNKLQGCRKVWKGGGPGEYINPRPFQGQEFASGPIKVNLEFSFSFSGFSFSGLNPIFFHFIFQFQFVFLISQQLLIVSLWFPTSLSSQTKDFELYSQLIIAFLLSSSSDLEFSFSNPGSDLEFSFSNPGLFEFQVWNKPGIEKLSSRFTLISPMRKLLSLCRFCETRLHYPVGNPSFFCIS